MHRNRGLPLWLVRGIALAMVFVMACAPAAPVPDPAPPKPAEAPKPVEPAPKPAAPAAKPAEPVTKEAEKPAAEPFYQGKTIRWIVAFAPGGAADILVRLMANHLGRHIEGTPQIRVENMPGAGGAVALTFGHGSARPDGLTIVQAATVPWTEALQRAEGEDPGYRSAEMPAVYGMSSPNVVAARSDVLTSLDELPGITRPFKMGATDIGSPMNIIAAVVFNAVGKELQIIPYGSTAPVMLAAKQGETDLATGAFEAYVAHLEEDIAAGTFVNLFESGTLEGGQVRGSGFYPNVPTGWDAYTQFTGSPPSGRTAEIMTLMTAGRLLHRDSRFPPNSPQEAIDAMRAGFDKMVTDPEFTAEYERLFGQELRGMMGGAQADEVTQEILGTDPQLILDSLELVKE